MRRRAITLLVALGLLAVSSAGSSQPVVDSSQSRIDADGTLHVSKLTIVPSALWSPQFKAFYAGWTAELAAVSEVTLPDRAAPRAEWDKYDQSLDDYLSERLSRLERIYPVRIQDTRMGGVRVGIVAPKDGVTLENRRRVLINLHSGGFFSGRGLTVGGLESVPVAAIGQIQVITLDYRQAPFHEFPAASEDVEAVYRELLKDHEPGAIGIFGCSAGGTLAAQAVAWFQAKGLPRPGAIGVFCTGLAARWTQPQGDSAMWATGIPQKAPSKAEEADLRAAHWYMEKARADDARAYPDISDKVLADFPPTLFLNGTRDFTMSAAIGAHARMTKLGVDTSLYIVEGGVHGAHVFAVGTPEAHDANTYIARWFDRHLVGTTAVTSR